MALDGATVGSAVISSGGAYEIGSGFTFSGATAANTILQIDSAGVGSNLVVSSGTTLLLQGGALLSGTTTLGPAPPRRSAPATRSASCQARRAAAS